MHMEAFFSGGYKYIMNTYLNFSEPVQNAFSTRQTQQNSFTMPNFFDIQKWRKFIVPDIFDPVHFRIQIILKCRHVFYQSKVREPRFQGQVGNILEAGLGWP